MNAAGGGRGAGADRLERLLRGVGESPDADPPAVGAGPAAEPEATGRARHAEGGPAPGRGGWRLSGVPTGAAVGASVVAVLVAVLLLGGVGEGSGEEVVPPLAAGPAPAAAAPTVGGRSDPVPDGAAVPGVAASPAAGPAADPAPGGGAAAGHVPTSSQGPLVVHVDGAVQRPGVVSLPAGSRVSDAVAAAGGVTDAADTRLVNLARLLADGELVVVPVPGEVATPPPGGPAGAAGTPAGAGVPAAVTGPVDLNAADAAALDELPGIGPVLAQRIVDHRDQVGPFGSVDDLDAVSGIGPAVMESLRDLVTV